MTLRQKPSRCLAGGLRERCKLPSGAINFKVFRLFESVANSRYRKVKPITTPLLDQLGASCFQSLIADNHKGFTPLKTFAKFILL